MTSCFAGCIVSDPPILFVVTLVLVRIGTIRPLYGLKCDLGGWNFVIEEDLQSVVAKFFAKQDTEWYSAGIRKLISRYNKCLDEQGDYVEN